MRTAHAQIFLSFCATIFAADDPPAEWIEPETGHRVVRLSREPRTTKLYFHQNAFTATGDKMLVVTPKGLSIRGRAGGNTLRDLLGLCTTDKRDARACRPRPTPCRPP